MGCAQLMAGPTLLVLERHYDYYIFMIWASRSCGVPHKRTKSTQILGVCRSGSYAKYWPCSYYRPPSQRDTMSRKYFFRCESNGRHSRRATVSRWRSRGISLPALLRPRQPCLPPHLAIALCEPFAGLDELDYVDVLLKGHDGYGHAGQCPGEVAVHLVRPWKRSSVEAGRGDLPVTGRAATAYLAISIAPALQGVVQIREGLTAGDPGCREMLSPEACNRDGDKVGEEKERR